MNLIHFLSISACLSLSLWAQEPTVANGDVYTGQYIHTFSINGDAKKDLKTRCAGCHVSAKISNTGEKPMLAMTIENIHDKKKKKTEILLEGKPQSGTSASIVFANDKYSVTLTDGKMTGEQKTKKIISTIELKKGSDALKQDGAVPPKQ